MPLTTQNIQKLARLSRLAIEPNSAEEQSTLNRLNAVFDLIAQLETVQLEGIEPLTHPQDMILRLRDDQVTETNQRELIQATAPAVESGLYLVPRVVE
jgi:aspartyl-tRNA(Asn)/glutamyl-tRNA(Gln) amidotransferase subunit C